MSAAAAYISTSLIICIGKPSGEIAPNCARIHMNSITQIATIVIAVLSFPSIPAAMTTFFSLEAATSRTPETTNSRARMSAVTHALHQPSCTKHTSAAATSILSASGSRNLPKLVIMLYLRAIFPSSISVILAAANTASAHR